eukprot:COSAG06_NODE_9289_length_1938_cov_1.802066_1_plen_55_part_10
MAEAAIDSVQRWASSPGSAGDGDVPDVAQMPVAELAFRLEAAAIPVQDGVDREQM